MRAALDARARAARDEARAARAARARCRALGRARSGLERARRRGDRRRRAPDPLHDAAHPAVAPVPGALRLSAEPGRRDLARARGRGRCARLPRRTRERPSDRYAVAAARAPSRDAERSRRHAGRDARPVPSCARDPGSPTRPTTTSPWLLAELCASARERVEIALPACSRAEQVRWEERLARRRARAPGSSRGRSAFGDAERIGRRVARPDTAARLGAARRPPRQRDAGARARRGARVAVRGEAAALPRGRARCTTAGSARRCSASIARRRRRSSRPGPTS